MVSDAQKRASKKYQDKNTVMMSMRLNYNTDADIIKKLNSVPSRQGYIKDLIRADIAKQ